MASPNKKTERGGFDCEFVEPPPEVLQTECPVCLQIIKEPHQVTCCGKRFCLSCIKHFNDNNKPCPTCKATEINSFPDTALKQTLYAFDVHCSHQKDGCEWTGELGQLDGHLNTDPQPEKQLDGCQFVEVNCIYDCGDKLQRQYLQKHQTKHCTKRPFSCEHCHDYESTFNDVIHNHWPVCGSFPLCCPNECGLKVQRQNVDSHVADVCPLTTISCDFLHVGCAVKLPRKDMPKHLRENLLTHISLLATSHAKQQAVITKQQEEIIHQKAEFTKQQAQIASLVAENDELNSENTSLEHNQLSNEANFAELQDKVALLGQENKSLKENSEAVSQAALTPRTTIPLGPPVLTMTNFQQHKMQDDHWYSPPVYIHHRGYKICLRVEANGIGTVKGTHVSAYVQFMKGEFDDSLKWPFRGVIHFQLLNQSNGTDKTDSIPYDDTVDDKYCGRVTERERARWGRGRQKFISHTKLEPGYLHNDTLLFQFDKVELK